MQATTEWTRADDIEVDEAADYLVKTNGDQWSDPCLRTMRGYEVARKLEPGYVRGRPEWIAKINVPAMSK